MKCRRAIFHNRTNSAPSSVLTILLQTFDPRLTNQRRGYRNIEIKL
jgi:hypothetical protein